jgi:hypothetical protein
MLMRTDAASAESKDGTYLSLDWNVKAGPSLKRES